VGVSIVIFFNVNKYTDAILSKSYSLIIYSLVWFMFIKKRFKIKIRVVSK